jgi:hypothetical protein
LEFFSIRFIESAFGFIEKVCPKSFFIFAVLGLELRAYTLSHSTSPLFVCGGFFLR